MNKNLEKLGNKVKEVDIFGEGISFNIGRNQSKYKTYLGSILTLAVIIITSTYAFKRYSIMLDFGDTVYLNSFLPFQSNRNQSLAQNETNFLLSF